MIEFDPPEEDDEDKEDEDEVASFYTTNQCYYEISIPNNNDDKLPLRKAIKVRETTFGCGKLGASVWESSIALSLCLANPSVLLDEDETQLLSVTDRRVLELGSGCGLPTIVCRDALGAKDVLATDFWQLNDDDDYDKKRLIPTKYHGMNLRYNVGKSVQQLDWHNSNSVQAARNSFRPDLIIGSDLIYYTMDIEPLVNTLKILLHGDEDNNENNKTEAILVLPLPPAVREGLVDFRSKLPEIFSITHDVKFKEMELQSREDNVEKYNFLVVRIIPK
eukprot:CAMPEP_0194139324 /NCGR_PEP_ID=MMETSP0152-20130528/8983_1 /TAXON_ID=1049557 /ORGANISM="Thalassiothrix antarctica, Strain L6-D1" /LENGTH=276 /DNA_ID=CAMNT_0038837107 /DNA_START=141 /DNA_END=971 /DNA_ORIENTATION=+